MAKQQFWLLKSEPDVFGFADLVRLGESPWDGVRNYQARNYMRDMKIGDNIIIYHSNATPPGIAGLARVTKTTHPDLTQFDPTSDYYDPKSTVENPRWDQILLEPVKALPFISLETLKQDAALEGMLILRKGNRLSVTPVEKKHYQHILKLGEPK